MVRESEIRNPNSEIPVVLTGLNSSQQEAIDRAVNCEVFHLIWGPPGTGKTKVIPEIVHRITGPVLLGAFTNTAVDKMLVALLEHDPAVRFLRVGRACDSPEVVAKLSSDPAECERAAARSLGVDDRPSDMTLVEAEHEVDLVERRVSHVARPVAREIEPAL